MLEPRDREWLFEALRPPVGYEFDQGVGTTFTLDLLALLIAPIAFTAFEKAENGDPPANSLGSLESLRRHSDRLTLFCHAGYTAVPRARYPQLAFVEESVVECLPENRALFHPKVWVLRYVGDGPTKYRVLNLSRNLVFARSWDTMLTLDGEVPEKAKANRANDGLVEFVRALPSFAIRTQSTLVADRLHLLATELQSVVLELPEGVDSIRFWPLGIRARNPNPFAAMGKRLLVVSPFVAAGALESLASGRSECTVVSTPTHLATLARRPSGVTSFKVLNDRALAEAEAVEGLEAAEVPASLADAIQLAQLHAKLYVTEIGAEAHVWTGSANATDSGLGRNVEMLVELTGHRKLLGIDALMKQQPDQLRFVNLLVDADKLVASDPPSEEERELERAFEATRRAMAGAQLVAHVAACDADGTFDVAVSCGPSSDLQIDARLKATIRPITMPGGAYPVGSAGASQVVAKFSGATFDALTAFFECDLMGRVAAEERHCCFVLTLPLVGAPSGRRDRILREMLSDRHRVFRFLMLLLADEGVNPLAGAGYAEPGTGTEQQANFIPAGLLEMLLRALDHAPSRLDHVESLLGQLSRDEQGRALLPEGFDAVWQPIWHHRQLSRTEAKS